MWKEGFGWTAVELGVGVAVALFLNSKAGMNGGGFVELGDSLKAGHATQRQCSTRAQRKAELLGGETR